MFPILFRSFYQEFWFNMTGTQFYLVFVMFPFWCNRVFFWSTSTSCFVLRISGTYDFRFDLDQFSIVLVLAHFSIDPVFVLVTVSGFCHILHLVSVWSLYPYLGLYSTQLFEFLLWVLLLFSASFYYLRLNDRLLLVLFWSRFGF